MTSPVAQFRPDLASFTDDPYRVYSRLRECAPVFLREGVWVVTRYDDVLRVVTSSDFATAHVRPPPIQDGKFARPTETALWLMDDEQGAPLRRLLGRLIRSYAATFSGAIENYVKSVLGRAGSIDVVQDIARPIASIALEQINGVRRGDVERVRQWADQATRVSELDLSTRDRVVALAAGLRLYRYFESRIVAPGQDRGDAVSLLDVAGDSSAPVSPPVLVESLVMLAIATSSTLQAAVANAFDSLARFDTGEVVGMSEAELSIATGELVRYEAPAHACLRVVRNTTELDGVLLQPGQRVCAVLASANRDESVFHAPEEVQLKRHPNPHLSFSAGPHRCIGAAVAIAGLQGVLRAVRDTRQTIQTLGKPRRTKSFMLRTYESLLVRVVPS